MPHDELLACGCGPATPCPKAAALFAANKMGCLVQHLRANARPLDEEPRRQHAWNFCGDGVVVKKCLVCQIQHTTGKMIGRAPMGGTGAYFWRKRNGDAWAPYPPLPECVSREGALRFALASTKTGNKRRRAA